MFFDCNTCDLTTDEQQAPGQCPRCGGELAPFIHFPDLPEEDGAELEFESLRDLWINVGFAVDDPEQLTASPWR